MLSGPHQIPKTQKPAKQLVVFLHGYGSNGQNLIDIADYWADHLPEAEFIAPNGLEPCEISPLGYQWFGLRDYSVFNIRAGLEKAAPLVVKSLIKWLSDRTLTPADLVLVGFSQGAMLALELMFHIPGIRGILGYSGAFFPPVAKMIPSPAPDIFLSHGDMDTVVPFAAFQESIRQLSLFGITPQTHISHGLGHSIDGKAIRSGGSFIQECFATKRNVVNS